MYLVLLVVWIVFILAYIVTIILKQTQVVAIEESVLFGLLGI